MPAVGGEGGGAGVVVPDTAHWGAWALAPGDRRVLMTAPTFPAGGQWTAMFGTIGHSRDGALTYTAPPDVPPYGLDEIDCVSDQRGGDIQLMVSVHRRTAPPAPQWRPQPVAWAPTTLLRRVPADSRDYAQTVRWLKGHSQDYSEGYSRRQRRAAAPPQRGGGYVLPAWVRDANVEVYTPAPHGARAARPVVCQGPSPINLPPPGRPTPGRTCAVAGGWQAAPVQRTGWKELGTWKGAVTSGDVLTIFKTYGTAPSAGMQTRAHVQYQGLFYQRVRLIDHYRCADIGRKWLYVGTTLCNQRGSGEKYSTPWLSVMEACPPNGGATWTQPQCHEIWVQRNQTFTRP